MTELTANTGGIRVFVYGSLKKGLGNHGVLGESEFLGRCFVEGGYTMYDLGWYPGVVANEGVDGRIYGEVYLVDEETLNALDILEGHPSYYERHKINTPWKKAWMYTLPAEYHNEELDIVPFGLWRPSDEEKEFANVS